MDDGELYDAQIEAHEYPREGWRGEYDRAAEYETINTGGENE